MPQPNEFEIAGYSDFLGGQDASKLPDNIPPNAYASGINVTTAKGILSPRWGFERKINEFPQGGVADYYTKRVKLYGDIFFTGNFQMAAPYSVGVENYILLVISGTIFLYNIRLRTTQILDIQGGSRISSITPRLRWTDADRYLIIFDNPAFPVIIEGIEARRSDPEKDEIPISVIGAYNQNRLFVGNAGNEFTGGDPVGSLAAPNAPITFQEVLTPGSPYFGQIFQLSTNYNADPITAMAFLQLIDTSTGIGPFLVATRNAIYSYNTQVPRDDWEAGQFGTIALNNAGIAGPRAFANVNSDLFFLSGDGQVRTFSMSRNEQGKWSKTPISREVQNWLKYWDKDLMEIGFVGYYQNKVFISANPYRVRALNNANTPIFDYTHGGLVVLEMDNVSSMLEDSRPVWAGLWTGVRPMEMVTIADRCFIVSKDDGGVNQIYEVNPELTYDTADGKVRYVKARVYTKEWDYEQPFANKQIGNLDLDFEQMQGDITLTAEYKPSHASGFHHWRTFQHKAPWRSCVVPSPEEVNGFAGQQIRDMNLGTPPDDSICSAVGGDIIDTFRKIQLALTVTGKYWELHNIGLLARYIPQNLTESICEELPPKVVPLECRNDWTIPEFEGCHYQVT